MRILITGGTGFLGSRLVKRLIEAGHSVVLILREKSVISRLESVQGQFDFFYKESDSYRACFEKYQGFDVIIHCATNYGRKNGTLTEVLEDNLIWPVKLLELAIEYCCGLFINTDTFFTKNNANYDYLREYIISKHLLRETLVSFASLISIANLRLEHVYGPDDSPDKFTSWILDQLMNNVDCVKLTDGTQKRDFIYLDDVVSAYCFVINNKERIKGFEEFEVGTGESHTIREFVELAKGLLNSSTELSWGSLPMRKNEFMDSKADTSMLGKLGWMPQFSFQKGVKTFIDYYNI